MWQGLKQTRSLEDRLAEEAKRLREQAELLPPGAVREAALQKALVTEQVYAWLTSAGLQQPK
jgi:hypothetical protein